MATVTASQQVDGPSTTDILAEQLRLMRVAIAQVEERLHALEAAENAVSAEEDIKGAKTLRRTVKHLSRQVNALGLHLERASARAEEAVRLASVAAKVRAQGQSTAPAGSGDLPLEPHLQQWLEARVQSAVQVAVREDQGGTSLVSDLPLPGVPLPVGMQESILLALAHYGQRLRNLARIESERLMDKAEIDHSVGRITARAVHDLAIVLLNLAQTMPSPPDPPSISQEPAT